jgi:hypothetical protein
MDFPRYNPNYPNEQPQQGYSPPQGQGYTPQQGGGFPPPQQGYVPPQQGYVPPQQGYVPQQTAMAPPTYYMPDESEVQAAYRQNKEDSTGGGLRPTFVKFYGPQGQVRWDDSVPKGYVSTVLLRICPPWAQGKNFFQRKRSHFVKTQTHPRGRSVVCPGPETCVICQGKELALNVPDPELQKRAKDFGRVGNQFLYNVFNLEAPEQHYGEDGIMRPFILGAGPRLHDAIGDLVNGRQGAFNIIDLMEGRPIQVRREKTGYGRMDIRYSVLDFDKAPLPPQLYPGMENLWDLEELDSAPTVETMTQIAYELGFPLPGAGGQSPHRLPSPAGPNPYQQEGGGMPPQFHNAQAQQFTPPNANPYQQQGFPQYGSQQSPPQFNPPPVSSTGVPVIAGYTPQPSQAAQQQNIQQNQGVTSARADGRDRCFGNYTPGDNQCVSCPADIQPHCMGQTGQRQVQPGAGGGLPVGQGRTTGGQQAGSTGPVRTPMAGQPGGGAETLTQLQARLLGR